MNKEQNDKLNSIIQNLKEQNTKQSAEEYLLGQLNPIQGQMLKKLMADDDRIKEFLASEEARQLLQQIMKDKE